MMLYGQQCVMTGVAGVMTRGYILTDVLYGVVGFR